MKIDLVVFAVYLVAVAVVGILAARKEKKSDDFFLAGRNLTWWIIGGSMIAANISTHHFIGMSGRGYEIGIAIASYEWIAAIALIIFGTFFLPYYLKSRITTMPEFLERRFSPSTRMAYAIICLIGYIVIELAVVLYTGALAINSLFDLPVQTGLLIFCVIGGGYATYGGFKSIAYTDVIQVTVLILGGLVVVFLGLHKVGILMPEYGYSVFGGFKALLATCPDKFHMVRPWNDPELPWIGVFFGGMWLANIFYWGCNQFITQRTLSARSIWHGQMGVVFAGFLKLLVPLLVVIPGLVAYRLYNPDSGLLRAETILSKADLAWPTLVKQLLPPGFTGLVMAGLVGCVMSHIASMLSASSTILTFDIYQKYYNKQASEKQLVVFGRIVTLSVLVTATVVGYFLKDLKAIFVYIQEFWSVAYPSVCALFLAGFFYKRATGRGAIIAIVAGPIWAATVIALEKTNLLPHIPFLTVNVPDAVTGQAHYMIPFLTRGAIDFLFAFVILWIFRNRSEVIPQQAIIDRSYPDDVVAFMKTIPWYKSFKFWSTVLLICVVALYIRFY